MDQFQQQVQILDENDTFSKKRISLHKVQHTNPNNPDEKSYSYHMVIVDLTMTINLTLSEASIINLINSCK